MDSASVNQDAIRTLMASAPPPAATKAELKKSPTKPTAFPVNPHGIPTELKRLNQWVGWRFEQRDGEWTKVPVDVVTMRNGSSTDPTTWNSFPAAWSAYQSRRLDGIGFVFAGTDLTGVDWDDFRKPDGTSDPEALAEVLSFGSYAEVSPTGGGWHVLCRVRPEVAEPFKNKTGAYEAYQSGRFFTVSGIGGGDIAEATERFAEWAPRRLGIKGPKKAKVIIDEIPTDPDDLRPDADEPDGETAYRIERLSADPLFKSLHAGEWEGLRNDKGRPRYPSQSEAVAAWCAKAAFYLGDDWDTADRLFRQSGLWSDKWSDGKWERVGEGTWADAVGLCGGEFFRPPSGWDLPTDDEIRDMFRKAPEPGTPRLCLSLSLDDLDALPDPEYLVERHLMAGSLAVVGAPPGAFKSFWALDLSLCVAAGLPFLGKHDTLKGGVVYIAGEGQGGMRRRARAWVNAKGGGCLVPNFRVVNRSVDLTDMGSAEFAALAEVANLDLPEPPKLVVIDTLARCYHGDENSVKEVGLFIQVADRLREQWGATVLIVHHMGKDKSRGLRGSTALLGAADSVFEMDKTEDSLFVKVRTVKQKDCPQLMPYGLLGREVLVKPDARYEWDRHSLVFDTTDMPAAKPDQKGCELDNVALVFGTGKTIDEANADFNKRRASKMLNRTFRRRVDEAISRDKLRLVKDKGPHTPAVWATAE